MPDPSIFQMTTQVGFSLTASNLDGGWRRTKSVNLAPQVILGRSAPLQTFASGNPATVEVQLKVLAMQDDADSFVKGLCNSLHALTYPKDPGIEPVTLCYITLGKIIDDWPCVLVSVTDNPGNDNIYDDDGIPCTAIIDLAFVEIAIENSSVDDWLETRNVRMLAWR
jgi:hypothetical protein